MQSWISGMPQGMFLKSEGYASNLFEPSGSFTLEQFCAETSNPYEAEGLPIALSTFISYGLTFQQRYVPNLENRIVRGIRLSSPGFRLVLDTGEEFAARRVVLATGMHNFGYVPPVLDGLPEEAVTHSSKHSELAEFDGQSVAIIGGGSSALDYAALLHERGIEVELFSRRSEVIFNEPAHMHQRALRDHIFKPLSLCGPGWHFRLLVEGAPLYRYLPASFRLQHLGNFLGPAGGWFIRDRIVGKVPIHESSTIEQARVDGGRVRLGITGGNGIKRQVVFDRVIAATGYKVDLDRLKILDPELRAQIDCLKNYPVVSPNFESSIPGLYFVGTTAGSSFGPLVRFACGAKLTSRRISRHLRHAHSE